MQRLFYWRRTKSNRCFTSFFGGRTQPGSCEVVKPTVVPQVWVLHAIPHPPRLQTEIAHDRRSWISRALWNNIKVQVHRPRVLYVIITFSMVAMNSMARVMRCSRVTNMSRYAIFNVLPRTSTSIVQGFPGQMRPAANVVRAVEHVCHLHSENYCWGTFLFCLET